MRLVIEPRTPLDLAPQEILSTDYRRRMTHVHRSVDQSGLKRELSMKSWLRLITRLQKNMVRSVIRMLTKCSLDVRRLCRTLVAGESGDGSDARHGLWLRCLPGDRIEEALFRWPRSRILAMRATVAQSRLRNQKHGRDIQAPGTKGPIRLSL